MRDDSISSKSAPQNHAHHTLTPGIICLFTPSTALPISYRLCPAAAARLGRPQRRPKHDDDGASRKTARLPCRPCPPWPAAHDNHGLRLPGVIIEHTVPRYVVELVFLVWGEERTRYSSLHFDDSPRHLFSIPPPTQSAHLPGPPPPWQPLSRRTLSLHRAGPTTT